MRTPHTAAIATAAALLLTACAGPDPDPAACKQAMAEQLDDAIDTGAEGQRPTACEGVDAATLERIVGEVTEEKIGEELDDAFQDMDEDWPDAPAP